MFRWIDCTDKTRPRDFTRAPSVKLRLAQLTDPHVPGDIPLTRRLRDLMRPHKNITELSHELSAISNELSQPYRRDRRAYTNLIKKALVGLHGLKVDHLLLTGDLAHCGMAAEFLEMKAILSITGWSAPERMTVIPGNHDRFNLYERIPGEPMEAYFDVVSSRKPRIKRLPKGVVLFELDSNSDRADDRHYLERWLPNTVGRFYPEAIDALEAQRDQIAGSRVIVLVHHHITSDWYQLGQVKSFGGVMDPAQNFEPLIEVAELTDPHALILHGHIHDVMPIDYTYGSSHMVGCPGGFAEHLRLNIIDLDHHDQITMTQLQLRA